MLSEFSEYDNLKDVIDIAEKEFSYLWIEDETLFFGMMKLRFLD